MHVDTIEHLVYECFVIKQIKFNLIGYGINVILGIYKLMSTLKIVLKKISSYYLKISTLYMQV